MRKVRVELPALSGQVMVKANTPETLQIRQAMEEYLDQKCPASFFPLADGHSAVANRIHRIGPAVRGIRMSIPSRCWTVMDPAARLLPYAEQLPIRLIWLRWNN